MSDSKRLFIGARVSVATANALAGAAETLARRARDAGIDIRWVAPVNYHLTFKFLGHTREAAIPAVRDALEQATQDTPRITFRTTRLGAFPSLENARVVWAGVEDGGATVELARRIEGALGALGYPAEHAFHPHVTIARVRETRPLRDLVLPLAEQMFGDTRIDSLVLFESETKSSGSVYLELCRIPFKTAQNAARSASERQTSALQLGDRKPRSTDQLNEPNHTDQPDVTDETDDGWPRGHVPNT
ncbi:MAG: 2-5 ligase [Deltaproteobacteria bacterium]|nr:2-5 ligase [Deltaproteobacteria bacterium]